jgi:phage protein D
MPQSPSGIQPARPTIVVNGEDKAFLAAGLLGLLVHETVAGLYRCEALFGNWGNKDGHVDFLYFGRDLLDFGKPFAVKVGDTTIFEGRVTGIEANFPEGRPAEIAVLAEDRFQDLRMTRRTRTFADISDSDVIRTVANDHGLTPQIDVSGPTHKVLAQVNQSDLAFLRDRARAVDAELWMEGTTLHAKSRASRGGTPVRMAFGRELREFSALSDLANQRSSVTVGGWDVSAKQGLSVEASDSAINAEVGNDESGASILKSALGERKEAVVHGVPVDRQEAQARAEACFRSIARRFVTGRGTAEPNGDLRVGSIAELDGLGPLFNGKYYLAEVRHVFDGARGMRTEFMAERPGIGRP